ncbi:MAG: hypothetical protein IPK32_19575 [Verrucomicrobiaceae bacterium]|nr:hypothetical protein [Verrucomicrobiaceae bacterium]
MKTAFALLLLLAATITGLAQSHTQHEKWWKHLSAQDSRAWSDEALRLMRLGAAPEAMAVLREAEQRFSKDLQLRQDAAEIAAFEENSPERLQRHLVLYSEAQSLRDQLRHARLIGANAATTDDFDRILREWGAQPPDVIHWLRLAALHAGAGDEKKQDECVREAAKLPSQQVDTLLELARYQEESLLFESMHATLESAVKLDTCTRARRWLAADELTWGSVEQGLRLYEQSQPESVWDAEDVLRVAGALLVCNEWQRMLTLLQQQCVAHPGDFRLRTMLAITQEEEGLVHEAVHTWLELLDMKKADRSLPRRLSIPAWSHVPLPRDTYIWLYIAGVISDAYAYRYRIESRAKGQMYPWTDDHTLPRSLDELPLHAFTHLRSLVHLLTPKEQEVLHVRLHGLGFPNAKDLLFVPIEEYRPRVDGTYLRKHASNVALHASWYLDQDQFQGAGGMTSRIIYYFPGDEPTPERLRHCFELFAPDYPELALNAAAHTSKSEQTLQKLPGVISRLGFASPGTLADLARLPKADIIRSAIAERITRWLEEDRIPVHSEKGLSELASQVKEAHPKLAALLGVAQARPGWASVNAAGTMFFNNYRTFPGWGVARAVRAENHFAAKTLTTRSMPAVKWPVSAATPLTNICRTKTSPPLPRSCVAISLSLQTPGSASPQLTGPMSACISITNHFRESLP